MSKKKIPLVSLIVGGVLWFGLTNNQAKNLVSPNLSATEKDKPTLATPIPSATPKTFKFDSSTDLKEELEKINPEILDVDFEE